eukprot:TRINITY_DN14680_c1_g1_i1.p1 TRINITY_DN14680_c1_g1~~TRINITY_DN14680_c1_g1_i1.p1  ORF type:complete len:527 (-),score=94.54 TRINITY_DN14680_c1_g1_i1:274-1629(-)
MIYTNEVPTDTVYGNVYKDNTLYVRNLVGSDLITESSDKTRQSGTFTTAHMARYANNTYCNLYGSPLFYWDNSGYSSYRGWDTWQSANRDQDSSLCALQNQRRFSLVGKFSSVLSLLNPVPLYPANLDGIIGCYGCNRAWAESASSSSSSSLSSSPFDVPSYHITHDDNPTSTNIQIQQSVQGNVVQGQIYGLRFRATATEEISLFTGLQMNATPHRSIAGFHPSFIIPGALVPQDFEHIFEAIWSGPVLINFSGKLSPGISLFIASLHFEQVAVTPQVWDHVALNPSSSTTIVPIPLGIIFSDLDGSGSYKESVILPPWSSKLLRNKKDDDNDAETTSALYSATTSAMNYATTSAFDSATTSAFDSSTTALDSATTSPLNSATTSAFDFSTTALYSASTTTALNSATISALDSATTTTSALRSGTTTALNSASTFNTATTSALNLPPRHP